MDCFKTSQLNFFASIQSKLSKTINAIEHMKRELAYLKGTAASDEQIRQVKERSVVVLVVVRGLRGGSQARHSLMHSDNQYRYTAVLTLHHE